MIADIRTVVWKEWKEILSWGGGRGKIGLVIFVGVFGIFLPLQMGPLWVESPVGLVYWAWLPLFLVISVIADSFAGERERHTLGTLLASRLSDRAILLGKIIAAMGYGVGMTWVSVLLGLVTVNIAHGQGKLLMYPTGIALDILGLSLMGSGVAASAGVLVSLRAATVRQAQQTLSIAFMVLLLVPMFGINALPLAWKTRLYDAIASAGVTRLVATGVAVLAVLNVLLLLSAIARFRRDRLTLD